MNNNLHISDRNVRGKLAEKQSKTSMHVYRTRFDESIFLSLHMKSCCTTTNTMKQLQPQISYSHINHTNQVH